ncbi:MAG: cation:proton antiporter [Gemmatimonadaceae bacterium]
MSAEGSFIILFAIATGVAMMVRTLRVPYTVALVLVGLSLGWLQLVEVPHLTKDLLFAVFLPGLLFQAAFNLDAREFGRNWLGISSLAVPGVIVGIALTGVIATSVIQGLGLDSAFSWQYGLVFGALVAATDPIAVVSLFRDLNAPARLRVMVEGESLLNDGTSIVVLSLILAYVGGVATSPGALSVRFITIVGGGVIVGGAIGFGASRVIARVDDAMIEITLTTIAAYGSFVLGEQLHYSGVIATVTAGMICGNYGRRIGMSPSTQLAVVSFWEYIAFALNSVIFLLIGFEVSPLALLASWAVIAIAFIAVVAGRTGVILGMTVLLRRTRERIPLAWGAALTWGGLRGALSMVLALALPFDFPERRLLITMTFGVAIVSILVQGVSMPYVLRRLGLVRADDDRLAYDIARGNLQIAAAGVAEVDRMRSAHAAAPDLLDELGQRYAERRDRARSELLTLHAASQQVSDQAEADTIEHLLMIEKSELNDRLRLGVLQRDAYVKLAADVDARLIRLQERHFQNPADLIAVSERGAASGTKPQNPTDGPDPDQAHAPGTRGNDKSSA